MTVSVDGADACGRPEGCRALPNDGRNVVVGQIGDAVDVVRLFAQVGDDEGNAEASAKFAMAGIYLEVRQTL